MRDSDLKASASGSPTLEGYSSGRYAREYMVDDDVFKASAFLSLFDRAANRYKLAPRSYVDVGCLGGGVVEAVTRGLRRRGHPIVTARGYDVSPQTNERGPNAVELVHGDFTTSDENVDLVTMFDVLEHVLQPIEFVRAVAEHCHYVGLHVPLDDSLVNGLLDRYRSRLDYPGHLLYLNPASALNLITHSGLRVVDYSYTFGFEAPSGSLTRRQRVIKPLRSAVARRSPWIASRVLGGVSLMVIAATSRGLSSVPAFAELGLDARGYLRG